MESKKNEFFPGYSHKEGLTRCRGWLCPDGVELILPFSLVSVESDADRYSEKIQLWLDREGCYWAINYNPVASEWHACRLGKNNNKADEHMAAVSAAEDFARIPLIDRVMSATTGKTRDEIWSLLTSAQEQYDLGYMQSRRNQGPYFYVLFVFKGGQALRVPHPGSELYKTAPLVELTTEFEPLAASTV